MFYGVLSIPYLRDMANEICDCIGHGKNRKAVELLVETCAAETHCGQYRDPTPNGAGRGVGQTDEGTFYWLKEKYQDSPIANRIERRFGINLARVTHQELDYNPLLSLIFTRLRYWVVVEPIPFTRAGRAKYWKDHYNTSAGAGDEAHYMKMANALLGESDV